LIVPADVLDLAEHVEGVNAGGDEDEREQTDQSPHAATQSIVLDLGNFAGGRLGHC
jgi:hypothetical protein